MKNTGISFKLTFKEGQTEIHIGKNKITPSLYSGYIDLHLVYSNDDRSGYIATDELGLAVNNPDYRKSKEDRIKQIEKDKKRGIEFKRRAPYNGKFVRVISVDNVYGFEVIKSIKTDNFNDEFNLMYFENGGYAFDKKRDG